MSKIVVPMYISITEESYQEFLEEHEKKGFVSIPYTTSKGMITIILTKISYEV